MRKLVVFNCVLADERAWHRERVASPMAAGCCVWQDHPTYFQGPGPPLRVVDVDLLKGPGRPVHASNSINQGIPPAAQEFAEARPGPVTAAHARVTRH